MSNSAFVPVEFVTGEDVGPRNWGREILLYVVPGKYSLKKIVMKAGTKGGLQHHHKKDEGGYIVSGELIVRHDDGAGKLTERRCGPGDAFHFRPGAVHQVEAVTDSVYIEASTPHFNDRVHDEERYGLPSIANVPGELPTTRFDEVEER